MRVIANTAVQKRAQVKGEIPPAERSATLRAPDKLQKARSQLMIEISALDAAIAAVEGHTAFEMIVVVEGKRAILQILNDAISRPLEN